MGWELAGWGQLDQTEVMAQACWSLPAGCRVAWVASARSSLRLSLGVGHTSASPKAGEPLNGIWEQQ